MHSHFWHQMCGDFLPPANSLCHQLAVLRFNSILIGSIWRYVRSHRWAQSHKTAPCHTHIHTRTHSHTHAHTHTSDASHKPWPTGYRSEIPRTLSSGLINLLEWLEELKKTFTYIYQFIKGYDKRYRWTTTWKDTQGKIWEGPENRSFCPHEVGICHLMTDH